MNRAVLLVHRIKRSTNPNKIIRLKKELRQYCYYSDINYERLLKQYGIDSQRELKGE